MAHVKFMMNERSEEVKSLEVLRLAWAHTTFACDKLHASENSTFNFK